jgi:hypothetical protein
MPPGVSGLNLTSGLIKQEDGSLVNNNEITVLDMVNNGGHGGHNGHEVVNNSHGGVNNGHQGVNTSPTDNKLTVSRFNQKTDNLDRVNTGRRQDLEGFREGLLRDQMILKAESIDEEEKAMNLSTSHITSQEKSETTEEKVRKAILSLQSQQPTTIPPTTTSSMVSQAFQLLPSHLLNPATFKDMDQGTHDQMAALLGADQMAALLGPLWKSRQPRMCQFCNRMFSNKFNLKQHILNMHTVGREMQCEICNKKVKNKWYLRRHHVTHHGAPLKK